MTLRCLVAITTVAGDSYAVVCVQTLYQLAIMMPVIVVTYKVHEIEEVLRPASMSDAEIQDALIYIVTDITSLQT